MILSDVVRLYETDTVSGVITLTGRVILLPVDCPLLSAWPEGERAMETGCLAVPSNLFQQIETIVREASDGTEIKR